MFSAWISSFQLQKTELKIASVLALSTACIVLLIVLWASFLKQPGAPKEAFSTSSEVTTTARPSLPKTYPKRVSNPKTKQNNPLAQATSAKQLKNTKKPSLKRIDLTIGQGNFFVQVGAFSKANLARLMLEKMKRHYKHAKIQMKLDKYAVWVGPVITQEAAAMLKKHLQLKNNIKGFIVTKK